MAYTRGNIVLLPFPYTDKSTRKVRPAVVVSEPAYEADTGNLIVAQITTKPARFSTDYPLPDYKAVGLLAPSVVRMRLATVSARQVRYQPGALSAADLNEVDKHLRQVLGI